MKTISFDLFALRVGKQSGETRAAAKPLHEAYKAAEPADQADLRKRWMLNHVAGQVMAKMAEQGKPVDGDAAIKAAEKILSNGKGKGATKEAIKAIDRASSDFRYHIVRPDGKPESNARTRVPAAVRAAAEVFLTEFEGKDKNAKIDAAIAALRAMKK